MKKKNRVAYIENIANDLPQVGFNGGTSRLADITFGYFHCSGSRHSPQAKHYR